MKGKIEGYHRAKAMLPEIRQLITRAAISTDTRREALADELIEKIKKNYPNQVPPTVETIIKEISKARNTKQSDLDKPWSMAVLNRLHEPDIHLLDAEAIMAIMKIQYYVDHEFRQDWQTRLGKNMKKSDPKIESVSITDELIAQVQEEYPVLTIRQAKWAARLYLLQRDPYRLYRTVLMYSNNEIVSEISETCFDTSILDQALFDWGQFDELVAEYGRRSLNDQNMSEASRRSFKPKQKKEEGK